MRDKHTPGYKCAFHDDRQDECKVYSGDVPCEPVATLPCVKLKVRELESGRLVVEVLAFDQRELTERGTVSVYSAAHVTRLQAEVDQWKSVVQDFAERRDELKHELDMRDGQRDTLQSELTKAQELLDEAATAVGEYGDSLISRGNTDAGTTMLDLERKLRADQHQSAPSAKCEPLTHKFVGGKCSVCGFVMYAPAAKGGSDV